MALPGEHSPIDVADNSDAVTSSIAMPARLFQQGCNQFGLSPILVWRRARRAGTYCNTRNPQPMNTPGLETCGVSVW